MAGKQDLQTIANKAAAHYKAGRLSSAEKFYLRALKGAPDHPQLLFAVATLYEELNKPEKALKLYQRAVKNAPDYMDAKLNLAACLQGLGQFAEAESLLRELVANDPGFILAQYNLGTVLADQARHKEAIEAFKIAVAINPDLADTWFNLANSQNAMGLYAEAQTAYEKAIELRPQFTSCIVNLGILHQILGQFDAARRYFSQALKIDPSLPAAHYQLSLMGEGHGGSEQGLQEIDAALENLKDDDKARATLHFAAARLRAKEKSFDDAFAHYQSANGMRSKNHPFNLEGFDERITRLTGSYSASTLRTHRAWSNGSEKPVFIVGMPRSGTTLVEQIAASHSLVHGMGERQDIVRFVRDHDGAFDPAKIETGQASSFIQDYLHASVGDTTKALRFTDKNPANFLNLGLIVVMFPEARIIHCSRDPLDTCLSCYFQNFSEILPFTNDLETLGHYYRGYQRLMAHWREALPNAMHEVAYEDIVANPEAESRKLIKYLGLDWEPACLEFFKSDRAVTSASVWQARQPVYTGSVGGWRNYEKHLEPLKRALGLSNA